MKKLSLIVLLLSIWVPAVLRAQVPSPLSPVPTYSSAAPVNTLPKVCGFEAGGTMVYCASGFSDVGGQPLYNGQPIGSSVNLASPGPIGATTPSTGAFTALSATGGVTSGAPSTAAQSALPTGSHGFSCDESSTTGVPAANVDYLRCDSATHSILESVNGGTESPLGGVANYWSNGSNGGAQAIYGGNNSVAFALMQLTQTTSFTGITYSIVTTDSSTSDHYDLGIYSCPSNNCTVGGATTTLVCDIGPTLFNVAAQPYHHACAQGGTVTLGPGTYVLAATGNATTGAFGAAAVAPGFLPIFSSAYLVTSSSAGQLPSSDTLPANGTATYTMPGFAITLH